MMQGQKKKCVFVQVKIVVFSCNLAEQQTTSTY